MPATTNVGAVLSRAEGHAFKYAGQQCGGAAYWATLAGNLASELNLAFGMLEDATCAEHIDSTILGLDYVSIDQAKNIVSAVLALLERQDYADYSEVTDYLSDALKSIDDVCAHELDEAEDWLQEKEREAEEWVHDDKLTEDRFDENK